jgi:hypothetical protein
VRSYFSLVLLKYLPNEGLYQKGGAGENGVRVS